MVSLQTGQVWMAFGPKPRTDTITIRKNVTALLPISIAPISHVARVEPFELGQESLAMYIHNNFRKKSEVFLGVLSFPIKPTLERAAQILNSRCLNQKETVGHFFPGTPTLSETTTILKNRFLEKALQGIMYRNTMYSHEDNEAANAFNR